MVVDPISSRDQPMLHQFGEKVLLGIFLGHVLIARNLERGYIMIADIEEMENLDSSEIHHRKLNATEVLTPQRAKKLLDSKPQMEQLNRLEQTTESENPLLGGNNL